VRGDWHTGVLGDFIELKRGYDLPKRMRTAGHYPIVSSSGVTGTHAEAKVKGPGVVTGRYGTIGDVFYLEHDFWPLNTTLYVRDFKGNDVQFISYFLKTFDYSAYSDKAAVPGVNRNHLHQAEVSIPPLKTQRKIAETLSTIDHKIELNHKTARTLEELAQRLFKSWFVDFDPVRAKMAGRQPAHTPPEIADLFPDRLIDSPLGPIPEGWGFRPLVDFADFVNGKNFTKNASGDGRMVIRIAELNSGPGARTVWNNTDADEKYIAEPGSILFAWSGSLGVYRWYRDSALINQHIFKVIPHDGISKAFCFQAVQHLIEEFRQIAAAKAVTMGHIKRSDLKEHGLHVPPDDQLIDAFSEIASGLWERALLLEQECETLTQLRDRLLPKLISGEIRVPDDSSRRESNCG